MNIDNNDQKENKDEEIIDNGSDGLHDDNASDNKRNFSMAGNITFNKSISSFIKI